MKKIHIVVLFLILSQLTIAQIPNFEWAKQMGGSNHDYGRSITTDASGNIYTTGVFEGIADFDPGPGITNLTSAGQSDIFIQKLDSSGNLLWAKHMGSAFDDGGYSIITDANSNVYTTGYFRGTVDFDPGVGTINLTSFGWTDVFIQKLDSSGNLLWVKQMGGTSQDYGNSITTDAAGNIYTIGLFQGTVDFDPGAGTNNLTSAGQYDIFIQKLNSAGNLLWLKQIGGTSNDQANTINVDAFGNVYTTGNFQDTVDFDPGTGTFNLISAGNWDIFIQKLDSVGNLLWVKQISGTSDNEAYGIVTDIGGDIYTTGRFNGMTDFDPGPGTTNLTSIGLGDIFIQKLDTAGNLLWVKQMGGDSVDIGISITIDTAGNVYTTGFFSDTVDFDPGVGTTSLTSAGSLDIFIQKLDSAGNLLWAKQMGGTSYDYGWSITTDVDGNIYTTGFFNGTADFEPGVGTTNLTASGFYDIFILKLSQCIPNAGTDVVNACDSYTWIDGITYTASNNTATYTLNNTVGCDSVITLNLTINNSSFSSDTVTSCDSYFWPTNSNTYTVNGIYTDTLSNAAGCDSVVTLNLTIDTVDISLTVTDPIIIANASGASYKWLDCNNNYSLIPGATAQSFTATANGDYAVEVTQNLCTDTSACITISTVGINTSTPLSVRNIEIYPNPTTGKIFIEGVNIQTVEIINPIGQTIKQYQVKNKTILIDLSSQTKGIYFVRITTNSGVVVEKVVLEN